MNEFKNEIKKQLDNDTNVLVFSNGDLNGCIGDINLIVQEIAIMIDKLSQQSGIKRKKIIQVIRDMLKELNYENKR